MDKTSKSKEKINSMLARQQEVHLNDTKYPDAAVSRFRILYCGGFTLGLIWKEVQLKKLLVVT